MTQSINKIFGLGEFRKQIINPLHRSYTCLSQKAKMQRIREVMKNIHPSMSVFLLKNQTVGEDPQKTAYEIFKLIKSHSRGMMISIAGECLLIGLCFTWIKV